MSCEEFFKGLASGFRRFLLRHCLYRTTIQKQRIPCKENFAYSRPLKASFYLHGWIAGVGRTSGIIPAAHAAHHRCGAAPRGFSVVLTFRLLPLSKMKSDRKLHSETTRASLLSQKCGAGRPRPVSSGPQERPNFIAGIPPQSRRHAENSQRCSTVRIRLREEPECAEGV